MPRRLYASGLAGFSVLALTASLRRLFRSHSAWSKGRIKPPHADASSRVRSEFLEHMSHELRTPLNAIIGLSNVLLKNKNRTMSELELLYVSRIAENGTQLLKQIDDVLSFARLEAGRIQFELRTISAHALLESIAPLVAPRALEKRITYSVQPVSRAIHVTADEERARHILLHLVNNALSFTPEGGHVALSCDARDDWVHLHIWDDGRGIPAEKLNAIFEPFTQVSGALHQRTVGVGLGLAISRDLARGMGGEIDVVSAEGRGSRFTLRLLRVADSVGPGSAEDSVAPTR